MPLSENLSSPSTLAVLFHKLLEPFLFLFQKLWKDGKTIIFVTHNPDIAQYSSRNIFLADGKVKDDTINTNILSAEEGLAALPKNEEE